MRDAADEWDAEYFQPLREIRTQYLNDPVYGQMVQGVQQQAEAVHTAYARLYQAKEGWWNQYLSGQPTAYWEQQAQAARSDLEKLDPTGKTLWGVGAPDWRLEAEKRLLLTRFETAYRAYWAALLSADTASLDEAQDDMTEAGVSTTCVPARNIETQYLPEVKKAYLEALDAAANGDSTYARVQAQQQLGFWREHLERTSWEQWEAEIADGFEAQLLKFPESYRGRLRELHTTHPTWVFTPYETGVDFNQFVDAEMRGGSPCVDGRDPAAEPYMDPSKRQVDGPFVAATREATAYFMDPRNFLSETQVFQFLSAQYNPDAPATEDMVRQVLSAAKWGALRDSADAFITGAGTQMNAIFLAAKAVVETGDGTNDLATGYAIDGVTCYNVFSIGAYPHSGCGAIENGARYAAVHGWTSLEASIIGGAQWIYDNYIVRYGQDSLYLLKWNPTGFRTGDLHQYATHIRDAEGKASLYATDTNRSLEGLSFRIPVYVNMPDDPVPDPATEQRSGPR